MDGLIVKSVGGFYHVKTEKGVYLCRARGLFKKQGITPTVGDRVDMEITHEPDREGIINVIHDRENVFVRPPISNVELLLVMVAAKNPDPNIAVIDRFLVTGELAFVPQILVINKVDLADAGEVEKIKEIYDGLYEVICISCKTGEGVKELENKMVGKRTALAGPSGVGKSSFLNTIQEDLAKTGTVSEKTGRGRHTTRHVEIFEIEGGGMVYDTPGFTSLDVPDMEEADLASCYPEMRPYLGECRFDNCRHLKEPDCAVHKALENGIIKQERYDSYVNLLTELSNRRSY